MTVLERIIKNLRAFLIALALIVLTFIFHSIGPQHSDDIFSVLETLLFLAGVILFAYVLSADSGGENV